MAIEHVSFDELKAYSNFDDVPIGALVQFGDETQSYSGVKGYVSQDANATLLVIIGGESHGYVHWQGDLAERSYVDISDIAEIVPTNIGVIKDKATMGATIGCVYMSTSIKSTFFLCGGWPTLNRKEKAFVCVSSASGSMKRGETSRDLSMSNLIPITTDMVVRRKDSRA